VPDNGKNPGRWSGARPLRLSSAAQQVADRRVGELLVALPDEAGQAEVGDLLAQGKAVYAIRRVRELTGLRLLDAKRLVDSFPR
jgi:ribosomal protein L7/L12